MLDWEKKKPPKGKCPFGNPYGTLNKIRCPLGCPASGHNAIKGYPLGCSFNYFCPCPSNILSLVWVKCVTSTNEAQQ